MYGAQSYFGCETALFWNDLGVSRLISGSYRGTDALTPMTAATRDSFIPRSKLGNGSIVVAPSGSCNSLDHQGDFCFVLVRINSTDGSGMFNASNAVTPQEAMMLDTKLDDGRGRWGRVQGGHLWHVNSVVMGLDPILGSPRCASASSPYPFVTSEKAVACVVMVHHRRARK
jgi:hypothetical protein